MAITRLVRHPAARAAIRRHGGFGLLAIGAAIRDDAEAGAPVESGRLSRSYFAAAFLDGERIGGDVTDKNGEEIPADLESAGLSVVVGSNSGYGGYVEAGTNDTPAQPTLVPAAMATQGRAARLFSSGARRGG